MPFYKKKGYVFSHSGNTYKFTEENFNNKYCNNHWFANILRKK